jgi:hypothetical protein
VWKVLEYGKIGVLTSHPPKNKPPKMPANGQILTLASNSLKIETTGKNQGCIINIYTQPINEIKNVPKL